MATNFPASLDALTNPTSSDSLSSPSHSAQHANVNDAVEALQAKVGADGSAVTTSHDYLIDKQSVVPYADASARTTAVPSPVEGQMSYLEDTNSVEVYDGSAWAAIGGGGQSISYTPTYINLTVGNGTVTANYALVGNIMTVTYVLILGSTTVIATNPVVSLPSGYSRAVPQDTPCGVAMLRDQGTRNYVGFVQTNANGLLVYSATTSLASLDQGTVTSAAPFTWAATDQIRFTATFEVA